MRLWWIIGALVVIAGQFAWIRVQSAGLQAAGLQVEDLQARLAASDAERALAVEAAAVHRANLARMEREREARADLGRELQELEGRDAPVPDAMLRAGQRLWGRD